MNCTPHLNFESIFQRILTISHANSDSNICSEKKNGSYFDAKEENHQISPKDVGSSTVPSSQDGPLNNETDKAYYKSTKSPMNAEQLVENNKQCPDTNIFGETSWKQLLITDSSSKNENILKLVEILYSSTTSLNAKFEILAYLSEECIADDNLFGILASSRLILFTEELLMKFCDAFLKYSPDSVTKELCLLKPLFKLLMPITKMSVQIISSTFLVKSDFLYQLMHTISLCSHNIVTTLKKLSTLTQGKNLACVKFLMNSAETKTSFEKCFNINLKDLASNLLGYNLMVFDTVDDTLVRNINEEIIKTQPNIDGIQTYPEANDFLKTTGGEMERSNVEVIRILPPKYTLVYMDTEWKVYLVNISAQVHKMITQMEKSYDKPNNKLHSGDTVGFCSNEARFEGEALIMVPYLRGEVLSVTGTQVMLWAMDVGLLSYIPADKLYTLSSDTLISKSPLVSIGVLKGPICDYDDEFLELAHKLLKDILQTNAQHGKHMFLSDIGEHILIFVQHPNNQIRIHILDTIYNLTNHCQEVRMFLEKQKFDLYLAGKLERYAHSYESNLCTNRTLVRIEMVIMTRILIAIFEEKIDIQNWPGKEQASKALQMLLEDADIQWTLLFRKCLRQLDGKPLAGSQDTCRGGGGSWKENFRQGSYQPPLRRDGGPSKENHRQDSHRPPLRRDGNDWKENSKHESYRPHFRGGRSDWKDNSRQESHRPHFSRSYTQFQQSGGDRSGHDVCYQSYEENLHTSFQNEVKSVHEEEKSLNSQVDYLIRGSKVDVKCDQTHHLMQEKLVHYLQEMKLAQILCGLLNNNIESYMYFGISEDSVVEGMLLTRDNKDVFRNGVDRTMSKSLLPEVQVTSYDIIFTPVLKAGDKAISLGKKSLYVIEIRVRPLRHMAYALHQCRKCYIRRDAETLESTITQKKNYMIEMEEKALDEATNSIKQISKGYLSVLAMFVNKYLPKEIDCNEKSTG